jgi:DNA-binding CsgD family transcriptional regulator
MDRFDFSKTGGNAFHGVCRYTRHAGRSAPGALSAPRAPLRRPDHAALSRQSELSSGCDESESIGLSGTPERGIATHALTPRQQDVLNLIVGGKSNKEIARALNLCEGTVKVHVAALFRNLGVNRRAAAAAAGARLLSGAEEGR